MAESAVYRRGYRDYKQGRPLKENPYVEWQPALIWSYERFWKHGEWDRGWFAAEHERHAMKKQAKKRDKRGLLAKDMKIGQAYECVYTDHESESLRSGDVVVCLRSHIACCYKAILNTRTQEIDSCTYDRVRFEPIRKMKHKIDLRTNRS